MTILNPTPCSDWVQKLSARHPDDLSPSDRFALNEHLALCRACTEAHTAYKTMEAAIRSLPMSEPLPFFSYQHPRLERTVELKSRLALPALFTLVLSVFSSFFIKISWSSFYQTLHTRLLLVIAYNPRSVTYVNANSFHTFALQSDSGYFLWEQERYQNDGIISTLPMHWSKMYDVMRVLPWSAL